MTDPNQLMRLTDVSKLTTLGKSTLLLWVAQGKFPKPIMLSKTTKVWRYQDVINWIADSAQSALDEDAQTRVAMTPKLHAVG
jgi:prophage regulatory protein